MASFRLKRKAYSENKEGMGMGTKIALGTIGTIGTLYGAKKGMFGNTARMAVNRGIMSTGKALGSSSMVKSGATDYAKGAVYKNIAQASKAYPDFKMSNMDVKRNIVGQRNFLIKQYTPKN